MIFKHNTLALTLVLLTLLQLSTQKTFPRLPLEVLQVMGSRAMRYHHFLWHNLREMWPLIDTATQQAIADLGWEPPRPSLIWGPNGSTANEENFSGEDFLYMHKQMVKQTNEILSKIQGVPYKKVVGFSSFPAPDDPDYPVPCNYTIPGDNNVGFTKLVASMKTDDFYYNTIVPTEAALKDPENLRRMNLGQLGSRLEYSVHQYMHLRFSKKTPYGLRLPVYNPVPQIDPKWDDLSYQWLADTYSSQLNPVFWRIHGWVEDRIEDWRVANGLEEINWQNTWEGGPAESIASLFEVAANSDNAKKDPPPPVNLDTGNTFSPVGTDDNATGGDDNVTAGDDSVTAGEENVTGGVRLLEEGEGHHHMGMASVETMEKVIQLLMKATNGKEATLDKRVKITPLSDW